MGFLASLNKRVRKYEKKLGKKQHVYNVLNKFMMDDVDVCPLCGGKECLLRGKKVKCKSCGRILYRFLDGEVVAQFSDDEVLVVEDGGGFWSGLKRVIPFMGD